MTGRQYAVTPVTLNLSASRINPRIHNVLPIRYQQQLQYEPDSAKCFIYRTQMHLQSFSSSSTLPEIRSKPSNVERVDRDRLSSVEDVVDKSEELLPNIRSFSDASSRQSISRKGSHYTIAHLDCEDEAQLIRQALPIEGLEEQSPVPTKSVDCETENLIENDREVYLESSGVHIDLIKDDTSNNHRQSDEKSSQQFDERDMSTCHSVFKMPKKKHKKKKTKSRKSDGRKSRTFNHRLKSLRKNTDLQAQTVASQNYGSSVLRYTSDLEPLGLLGARVKPIKVVQREPVRKSASHRLFHSAGRPADSQNSPRLADRTKTHLTLSPPKTPSIRTPMPTAVASPMTPWVVNEQPTSEFTQKHVQELTLSPQKTQAQSPRISQEIRKLTKVYLSERQSGKLQELGMDLPCAPPATPAPEMYAKYEYVPSMGDIRSQRAVKMRLEILERQERKIQEKRLEEKLKKEKKQEKERERYNRRRQRKEIYALNKIMTELEHTNFKEFCKVKGIDPKM